MSRRCARRQAAGWVTTPRDTASEGYTLVELLVTMLVSALVLALIPPLILTVSSATSTARGISTASAEARLAVQNLTLQVSSATYVCNPTTIGQSMDTFPSGLSDTVPSGMAVRAETQSFGTTHWVQWVIDTADETLYENQWPALSTTETSWTPVARAITSTSSQNPLPFIVNYPPTITLGSPQTLSVDLFVSSTTNGAEQKVEIQTTVSALSTAYSDSETNTGACTGAMD